MLIQSPPQTLIEAIEECDLEALKRIEKGSGAFDFLVDLVRRMPEPRTYVCEPFESCKFENDPIDVLWGRGRDVFTAILTQQGRSVIDPDTVRLLLSWHPWLNFKVNIHNPLLCEFALEDSLLESVYLADEGDAKFETGESLRAIAEDRKIAIHLWKPTNEV